MRRMILWVFASCIVALVGCADEGTGAERSLACGDGIVDSEEVCDDGNTTDGDGCSADCLSDESCGNGVVDSTTGEACDDGNTTDGDGCQASCALPTCGDGVADSEEVCDDGNTTDGDGCSATCMSDETCGNGVVDDSAGETCDDGNTTDGDGCPANCTLPICGNGAVEDGEVCDDSNTEDGDGCSASCTSDETCGNGVLDSAAGEVCDDGNIVDDGNGCSEACLSTLCGDGVVDTEVGEECDDGNTTDDDNGCAAICLRENKDDFEADDDFANANSMPIDGTVVTGHNLDIVTEDVEDEDWYAIDIVDTMTFYEVALTNASCESGDQRSLELTLYDTDGSSELRETGEVEGESGRTCPTLISQFPAAGTYYVRVSARYGRGGSEPFGSYDLSVSTSTYELDGAEPNDSFTDAARLTVDGPSISDLNLLGDVDENDWFVFNVDSTTDLYDVRIDSPNLCVTGDMRSLRADLVDTDGSTEIDSRFEGGGQSLHFCPRWVTTFSSTGDHYLDVYYRLGESNAASERFESYSVTVSKVVLEATEPDDDYLSANPLALSTPSTGHRLYSSSDEDWLSFVVTDTVNTHRIEVIGDECEKGDARRLQIELFDVDGTSSLSSAAEGEDDSECAVIDYDFSAAGTYFVRLSGSWGGNYASGWEVPFENAGVQVNVLLP